MSYTLIRFGTTPLPGYNTDSDVGTGRAAESILDLPGGGIWDAMGDGQGLQKSSTITKRLLAIADAAGVIDMDTIAQAHRDLRAMVGQRERLFRRWTDGVIEWCWARLSAVSGQRGSGLGAVITPLTLEFRKVSPHWYGRYSAGWVLDSEDVWGYPFRLDSGLYLDSGPSYTQLLVDDTTGFTAPNDGNAPILNARLVISADIGSGEAIITQFLTSLDPISDFAIDTTITYDEPFTMDNGAMSVEKGTEDYNTIVYGPNHADNGFFTIPVGGQTFALTDVGGTITCTAYLYYYEAWQ